MVDYVLVKFTPNLTVHPVQDPMTLYTDWGSAEAAAIAAQTALLDGSSVAILEAVAVTSFTVPPVQINLLGATVPTTV